MKWDNIPSELKLNGLWCVWKMTDGKKLPYNAVTGALAKSNDKRTFHPFSTVITRLSAYLGYDEEGRQTGGLGLGIFNGYSAIDIDHCRDEDGALSDMASDIIKRCNSYTEISPSGTGVRIIFKTDVTFDKQKYYTNNSKLGLEIYISEHTNKYVTITGKLLGDTRDITTVDIMPLLDEYMLKPSARRQQATFDPALSRDEKLRSLWFSPAPGSGADESERDLALCSKLAFYLKNDRSAVDDMFRQSPYYASKDVRHTEKWERRDDYREQTLDKACSGECITERVSHLSPAVARIDDFGLTDTGNAHQFVEMFGGRIKYNIDNKQWMVWNDKFWQTDTYGTIKNYAELVIEQMKLQAKYVEDDNMRSAILANVRRALSSAGKTAMLRESEHLAGIPVTNNDFDIDPYLFCCKSGVIDLRTGKIVPHDRSQMISKYSPYEISHAVPKRWLKFLDEIFEGNSDVVDYMQRVLGYAMTGSMREQCMFMLIGDGSNGKSLLLEIMNKAMGSYGATSNVDILLEKHTQNAGNLGDIARLNKIRNVITDEAKLGDKLNESAIKTMTSGIGKIVARFLYGNEFEFTPIFKIFMASNYKPVIRGTDHGIWRRIRTIPFNVVIPDDKQDKDLVSKLSDEIPQILGWMIDGAMKWQAFGLTQPAVFDEATREYRAEMDVVQRWLDEVCEFKPSYRTKSSELFKNFSQYAKVNREFEMSHTAFGRNLSRKYNKRVVVGVTYYYGIALKGDNPYRDDEDNNYI